MVPKAGLEPARPQRRGILNSEVILQNQSGCTQEKLGGVDVMPSGTHPQTHQFVHQRTIKSGSRNAKAPPVMRVSARPGQFRYIRQLSGVAPCGRAPTIGQLNQTAL
ncbi:hypothetical protein VWZ88_12440 [Phaeobacter sp. JH20_36]